MNALKDSFPCARDNTDEIFKHVHRVIHKRKFDMISNELNAMFSYRDYDYHSGLIAMFYRHHPEDRNSGYCYRCGDYFPLLLLPDANGFSAPFCERCLWISIACPGPGQIIKYSTEEWKPKPKHNIENNIKRHSLKIKRG